MRSDGTQLTDSVIPRGKRQEMVFLSHDEVLRLAHEVAHPPETKFRPATTHPAFGLLVRFTALTGLRAGEVCALRVGRVNRYSGASRSLSPSPSSVVSSTTARRRRTSVAPN